MGVAYNVSEAYNLQRCFHCGGFESTDKCVHSVLSTSMAITGVNRVHCSSVSLTKVAL